MVLKPVVAKGLRLKIKTKDEKIGYIMGAGDEVPNCLQQMDMKLLFINQKKSIKKF